MKDAWAMEFECRRILGLPFEFPGVDHVTMECPCETCKQRRFVVERVLAERERCAKIVDDSPDPSYEFDRSDLDTIAKRIRSGS